jgi:branched-chain amino acid transport system substrate-binding protein
MAHRPAMRIVASLKAKNLKLLSRIPYNANVPDVSAQVLQMKSERPDVVIFVSYTSYSILYIKTMHNLNYKPPIVIGDDSTSRDMDDTSARSIQGLLVLCDAINRGGSTRPEAIRMALQTTDLRPSQLMIRYDGVKFDAKEQNELAATLLVELQGTPKSRFGLSGRLLPN